jgi:hypothetical protein
LVITSWRSVISLFRIKNILHLNFVTKFTLKVSRRFVSVFFFQFEAILWLYIHSSRTSDHTSVCSTSCDIGHWTVPNFLLAGNGLICEYDGSSVKYWHSVGIFWIVCTRYYLSNDENGSEIAVREIGQDITWQMKSAYEHARYTVISGKLRYPANVWSQRSRI